jgi:hypothetical protein
MIKILVIIVISVFFLSLPCFAGDAKVYTNEDLENSKAETSATFDPNSSEKQKETERWLEQKAYEEEKEKKDREYENSHYRRWRGRRVYSVIKGPNE